jgi:hypothetical protein
MDKASGVYWSLNDQSIRPTGSVTLGAVVLMFTHKGPIDRLIKVTAENYQDLLGYDPDYFGASMAGLSKMLNTVDSIQVLRLNAGATGSSASAEEKLYLAGKGQYSTEGESIVWTDFQSIVALEASLKSYTSVWYVCPDSPGKRSLEYQVTPVMVTDPDTQQPVPDPVMKVFSVKNVGSANVLASVTFNSSLGEVGAFTRVKAGEFYLGWLGEGMPAAASTGDTQYAVLGTGGDGYSLASYDDQEVSPLNARLNLLRGRGLNLLVTNGTFVDDVAGCKNSYTAIANFAEAQFIPSFVDVPPQFKDISGDPGSYELGGVLSGEAAVDWSNGWSGNEYCSPVAGLEPSGSTFIYPSAQMVIIYANMFRTMNSLNYPPAGRTYGSVTVSSLVVNDFTDYADQLKTARVNYLKVDGAGVVMWEERNKYNLDSDLSRIHAIYILMDLRAKILDVTANYNFRFMTPVDLLNLQGNLKTILDDFKANYFLVAYTLKVPIYEQVQEAGTEFDVDIGVAIINAAEVINIKATVTTLSGLTAV